MNQWLKSIRGSIEDTTWTSYDVSVRSRLTEYFQKENPLLTDFSPQHLQDFYAWMRSRNLTGNTLVHYHACIRKALNQAFKNGLVGLKQRSYEPHFLPLVKKTSPCLYLLWVYKNKHNRMAAGAASRKFHPPVVLTGLPSLRATLLTLKL